jgi:hypothetical protein
MSEGFGHGNALVTVPKITKSVGLLLPSFIINKGFAKKLEVRSTKYEVEVCAMYGVRCTMYDGL